MQEFHKLLSFRFQFLSTSQRQTIWLMIRSINLFLYFFIIHTLLLAGWLVHINITVEKVIILNVMEH